MQISEPAEYVILGLLKSRPMHGYEMIQQVHNSILGEMVHVEMSQLYAFLKKLEKLTYIEAELESQGVRPPRRIYHLTPSGEETLVHWLTLPVDKPRDIRILFLIKLYFVQQFFRQQTSELVAKQIQACQRFLEHLEAKQQSHNDSYTDRDESFLDHVVLRSRIYQTHSLLDWLDELQTELVPNSLSRLM